MAKQGYSLYSPTRLAEAEAVPAEPEQPRLRRDHGHARGAAAPAPGPVQKPEVVAIDKLRIGQSMTVTLMERPSRKQKKAAREAGTSA